MAFIKNLYHDEIREGWLVTADIKKVWNRQLEMWAEVDRICRKHAINYWAGWGTLIGAARHKGFIPWDEDLDLCMMRPDYNRFFNLLDTELRQPFAINVRDFSTIKIAHTETTLIAPATKKDKPAGLMIDIFALDMADNGTPENFAAFNALKEVFLATFDMPKILKHVQNNGYIFNELSFLKSISEIPDERDRNYFACIYANEFFNQSPDLLWLNDCFVKPLDVAFRKEWFDETIYLPFETVELPAPKMFDEVLTRYYGDWRTPFIDGHQRLGLLHSADIPYKEVWRQIDVQKILDEWKRKHKP